MKFFSIFIVFGFLVMSLNSFSQIKVNSSGKVGINNTSPTYQLDVSGNFRVSDSGDNLIFDSGELYPNASYSSLGTYSNYWDELHAYNAYFYYYTVYYSDKNVKTDIKDMSVTKDKLKQLRPVKYKMKPKFKGNEKADAKIAKKAEAEQLGFIAQEVQKIYPEIVVEDDNGTLGIRYTALTPALVKAFQEQQAEIDDLKARIEKLEAAKK